VSMSCGQYILFAIAILLVTSLPLLMTSHRFSVRPSIIAVAMVTALVGLNVTNNALRGQLATPASVIIVDDGSPDFTSVGFQSVTPGNNRAYGKTISYARTPSDVSLFVSWRIKGLTPNVSYDVYATWPAGEYNTPEAMYSVSNSDGYGNGAARSVSQKIAPGDMEYDGRMWKYVGNGSVVFDKSSLIVTLKASPYIQNTVYTYADAILVTPTPVRPAASVREAPTVAEEFPVTLTTADPVSECGNRTVEQNEQCDDGNGKPGDGCSTNCQNERCGDNIVNGGEECDTAGSETVYFGTTQLRAGCSAQCVFMYCGDAKIQALLGETCDDGNRANGDGCSNLCKTEVRPAAPVTTATSSAVSSASSIVSSLCTPPAIVAGNSWQNPVNPLNVDNSQLINGLDVAAINRRIESMIAAGNDAQKLNGTRPAGAVYPDVNGDGYVTAMDSLMIINYMNRGCDIVTTPAPQTNVPPVQTSSVQTSIAPAAAQRVVLNTISFSCDNSVTVSFNKNFETCAHLKNAAGKTMHVQNIFCGNGPVTLLKSSFTADFAASGRYQLCNGNDSTICSAFVPVALASCAASSAPVVTPTAGCALPAIIAGKAWQNPRNALDVNANGRIEQTDGNLIISLLNQNNKPTIPAPVTKPASQPYFDVNGDGVITSLDALRVANYINAGCSANPPQAAVNPTPSPAVTPQPSLKPAASPAPSVSPRQGIAQDPTVPAVVTKCTPPALVAGSAWQNPNNPLDVNNDGKVNESDVTALDPDNHYKNGGYRVNIKPNSKPANQPFQDVDGNKIINVYDYFAIRYYLDAKCDVSAPVAAAPKVVTGNAWQNPKNPLDVNNNGGVDTDDLERLRIMIQSPTKLNSPSPSPNYNTVRRGYSVSPYYGNHYYYAYATKPDNVPFLDVNGDGYISDADMTIVSGYLQGGGVTVNPPAYPTGRNGTCTAPAVIKGRAWQNQQNPFDVDGDGIITFMDLWVTEKTKDKPFVQALPPDKSIDVNAFHWDIDGDQRWTNSDMIALQYYIDTDCPSNLISAPAVSTNTISAAIPAKYLAACEPFAIRGPRFQEFPSGIPQWTSVLFKKMTTRNPSFYVYTDSVSLTAKQGATKYETWLSPISPFYKTYVYGFNKATCETVTYLTPDDVVNYKEREITSLSIADNGAIAYTVDAFFIAGSGKLPYPDQLIIKNAPNGVKKVIASGDGESNNGPTFYDISVRSMIARDGQSVVFKAQGINPDNDPSTAYNNADNSMEIFLYKQNGTVTQITNFSGNHPEQYAGAHSPMFEDPAGRFITMVLNYDPVTLRRHTINQPIGEPPLPNKVHGKDVLWEERLYLYDVQTKKFHALGVANPAPPYRSGFQSLIKAKIGEVTGTVPANPDERTGFLDSFMNFIGSLLGR
jgi:cysteine-rich repeat protein